MKRHIPTLLTLTNLFLGCVALVCAFNNQLKWVPYLVFFSGIADAFDGLTARMLNVSSELGKELDSLADMVTFGVVPGVVLYHLLIESFQQTPMVITENQYIWALPAFLITLFSALRLAKFNIDTRQSTGFIGLATPACTMFFIGLIAAHNGTAGFLTNIFLNSFFLYAVAVIFSFLLISEIPMFSAKTKNFKLMDNKLLYFMFFFAIASLIIWGTLGLTISTLVYIALSIGNNVVNGKETV